MKLDHLLTPHTRINSKWIKDYYVRIETIQILEENIYSKTSDIAGRNFLLNISPGKGNKRRNKQMGLHQTKKFLCTKENINKIKRQPTE